MGFVTPDIRASMREVTDKLGVAPWLLRERGVFPVQSYRGQPTRMALAVAMGYSRSSDMQYEFIQQLDDLPSIYRDIISRRGYGFHHYGVMTRDFEASFSRYRREGFALAYEAEVPGGRVCFFDTSDALYGMVELVEQTPALEGMFEGFRTASLNWDGADAVRLRAALPAPT